MNKTDRIYKLLLDNYGPQGWWPVLNVKTGHSVYSGVEALSSRVMFEICIGAILTQNVAWKNVEKSLVNIKTAGLLAPVALDSADNSAIAGMIKSSGYYNQKAIKIKNFLSWFKKYRFSFKKLESMETGMLRSELLSVNGIGPETADSILLYALQRKIFVVDAYTRRIFSRIGLVQADCSYDELQSFFHKTFSGETAMYNEYHALIVSHGKDICRNKPGCDNCCLHRYCLRESL